MRTCVVSSVRRRSVRLHGVMSARQTVIGSACACARGARRQTACQREPPRSISDGRVARTARSRSGFGSVRRRCASGVKWSGWWRGVCSPGNGSYAPALYIVSAAATPRGVRRARRSAAKLGTMRVAHGQAHAMRRTSPRSRRGSRALARAPSSAVTTRSRRPSQGMAHRRQRTRRQRRRRSRRPRARDDSRTDTVSGTHKISRWRTRSHTGSDSTAMPVQPCHAMEVAYSANERSMMCAECDSGDGAAAAESGAAADAAASTGGGHGARHSAEHVDGSSSDFPPSSDDENNDGPTYDVLIKPRRTRRTDHTLALTTPARALLRCHLGGGETRLEHARRPRGDG